PARCRACRAHGHAGGGSRCALPLAVRPLAAGVGARHGVGPRRRERLTAGGASGRGAGFGLAPLSRLAAPPAPSGTAARDRHEAPAVAIAPVDVPPALRARASDPLIADVGQLSDVARLGAPRTHERLVMAAPPPSPAHGIDVCVVRKGPATLATRQPGTRRRTAPYPGGVVGARRPATDDGLQLGQAGVTGINYAMPLASCSRNGAHAAPRTCCSIHLRMSCTR